MKISNRVSYGLHAMITLAMSDPETPTPLREMAEEQGIPAKYLEQTAAALKIAGLLDSVRGAHGGYRLTRSASEITVLDIYVALDSNACQIYRKATDSKNKKVTAEIEFVTDLNLTLQKVLQSKTLADLATREAQLRADKQKKRR